MRWDKLFEDLESQLEQELTAEELDLEAEEERLRLGRLSLRERLLALSGSGTPGVGPFGISLASGARLTVRMVNCGRDWFSADLVNDSSRHVQCIVPMSALTGISLTRTQVATSLTPADESATEPLSARLSLSFVLRDLCRRRRPIDLALMTGDYYGTIDRVGRDHLDVAIHERGRSRRDSDVLEFRTVPLAAVQLIRL